MNTRICIHIKHQYFHINDSIVHDASDELPRAIILVILKEKKDKTWEKGRLTELSNEKEEHNHSGDERDDATGQRSAVEVLIDLGECIQLSNFAQRQHAYPSDSAGSA